MMSLTTSITHLGEQVGRLVPANNSTLMCVTVKSPLSDYGDPSDLPEWCVAAAKNKKTKLALCIRWMMVFHEILPLTLVSLAGFLRALTCGSARPVQSDHELLSVAWPLSSRVGSNSSENFWINSFRWLLVSVPRGRDCKAWRVRRRCSR